jgi:GNAT superfamily N-acetyltransferase
MNSLSSIIIKKAEFTDANQLYQFGLSIPELKVSSQSEFMTFEELKIAIEEPNGILFLAKCEDSIIGFIFALIGDLDRIANRAQACLVYLAILPEFRRQGIAQKLYDKLQEELIIRDVTYTYVWACPTSGIVNFMKRQGYKPGRTCIWMDKFNESI